MSRKHRVPKPVQALLDEIDWTSSGPQEEHALIDRALALSRETGDERAEYEVRLRLNRWCVTYGDTDTLLSSFAWCLAKHDADPRRFPTSVTDWLNLMWQFKSIVPSLSCSPIYSLAQCEAMLADMEAHYAREGLGTTAVILARLKHAWRTGDLALARQLRPQLQAAPRDEYTCEACLSGLLATFALATGEEALALKLADELVESGAECNREPNGTLARTLVARLRAGQTDIALDLHMQSYRLARTNPDDIRDVADNMVFCAVTGNEARGLAMVERHAPWLAHDALDEDGQLTMLTAVGLVLEAVVRAGHGEQVVRGAGSAALEQFFGPHDGAWTAAALAPAAWQAAGRLAAAFDARNGNGYVSDQVAQTRALLDERYDLPILTEVFLPPTVAPAQPTTAQGWLDLAEVYGSAGHLDPALEPATKVLDQASGATPDQQARAAKLIIWRHLRQDSADEAQSLLARRTEALRAAGRTVLADLETRLGLSLLGQHSPETVGVLQATVDRLVGTGDEGLADAQFELAAELLQAEDPDFATIVALLESVVGSAHQPDLRASALSCLTRVHLVRREPDQAEAAFDRALRLDLSDGLRARLLNQRAHLMGMLGRFAEGAADADAAVKIYAAYGATKPLVETVMLAVTLDQEAGHLEESLARLRYALREAEQAEIGTVGVRYQLGQALVATGHPTEGVEILWQVLGEEEAAETLPEVRAETCLALEQGFEAAEEYGSALSMCRRAADLRQEAEQPAQAADMLRRAGNLLRAFQMYDESSTTLAEAWDLVKDSAARGMQVEVLEAWAFTKGASGEVSALSDLDQALAIVQADTDGPHPWKTADLTHSKALVLMDLERRDEAVAGFLQAADGYAQADDPASAARAEHFAAQNLAGPLERPAEAPGIWHSALDHVEAALTQGQDVADLRESILLKLAEALDSLGRTAEAAATRDRITDQEPSTEPG
ncbi:MAG: hypothetical protein FWH11_08495 [Micrococcales bacterium]|nr:hypothetical protein [Micrococcales bacterium]